MRARAASSGDMLAAAKAALAAEAEAEAEAAAPEAVLEGADAAEDDEADVGEGAGEVAGAGGGTNAVGTSAPSSHTIPRHGSSDRSVVAQSLASVSGLAITRSHLGTRGPSGNWQERQRERDQREKERESIRERDRCTYMSVQGSQREE